MSTEFILFDLPSKQDNNCWSPNTWKARAALNFKKVPYKTEWTTYPELEPKFKDQFGIPPNPEGSFARYTVPVVRFPDGSFVMESGDIAKKLEDEYPEPSLQLDDALQEKTLGIIGRIIFPMAAFVFPRVHRNLVTEGEMDWIRADREERVSKWLGRDHITLEEWENESGGHATFEASEPAMQELSNLLKEHKKDNGPFILGSEPCYADLMVAGLVEFYRRVGDGAHEKLIGSVEGLRELSEACSPWFERRNY